MSWQTYVDVNLVGSGKVSRAAILGLAGGVWAATPGYSLSSEEQKVIVSSFKDSSQIQIHGVKIAGNKFNVLRATERSIYLRKGGDGAILVKTKQATLVAEYLAPIQAGEATPVVEGVADYLIGVGY